MTVGAKYQQTVISGMRSRTEQEPCQPLDYSRNHPLDLSRAGPSYPVERSQHPTVRAGRNLKLLESDWSDGVEGKPWRYSISDHIKTPPTVDLIQSFPDPGYDSHPAQVSLSDGEDYRAPRGFSDSEELFVFKAPRSEISFNYLWSFSSKRKNNCDKSRYSHSHQAVYEDQPKQSVLLEASGAKVDFIELADQTGSPSDSELLLEHEESLLSDPELQMFPLAQPSNKKCEKLLHTEIVSNEVIAEAKVTTVSPAVPDIVLEEIQSSKKLPISNSESDGDEWLDDDLMIDLE